MLGVAAVPRRLRHRLLLTDQAAAAGGREVKIDASFVQRIAESDDDYRIVRSIVDLVRSLGLHSVAEGVESDEWDQLAEMGCEMGQGWLFGEPMPPAEATVWLREHHESPPEIEYGYRSEVTQGA